jgi:GTPase SAR1 family protein
MSKAQDIKQYLKLLETIKNSRKEGNKEMAIPITRGKVESAKKCVVYGPEGIGKSTLAAQFPDPVFIDTEGSTKELDVARYPSPETWNDIITYINDFMEAMPGKTLVIDTADWAEALCISHTCSRLGVKGIEDVGYGKGYVYLSDDFTALLRKCDELIAQGVNVVFTAHASMRKFEQPDEMGAYDRWEMKLTKKVAPLLKEWADLVLFCNYKTDVITDQATKSKKATGGKRIMYASHHPCWDAKNRYGLPDSMPMEFNQIKHLFEGIEAKAKEPDYRAKIREYVKSMTPEDKKSFITKYGINVDTTNDEYKAIYGKVLGGI